ncbi:MAG: hypothetical protein ACRDYA_08735 [Egibacteraceae bacterium]
MDTAAGDFHTREGFCHVPNLISDEEAATLARELECISGLPAGDNSSVLSGARRPYYRHGVVASNPGLWPLLIHPRLVQALTYVLYGSPPRCLPGIDTAGMHASETEPHRDASPGELPVMADNPSSAICPVVRVILYPGSPGEQFGLLPCSHRRSGRVGDLVEDGRASWRWITLRKGDAVLFDPRLIHAGAIVTRPKPMIVLTYGADGPHSLQTYFHARIRTRQLGFPDPSPPLIDLLESKNLLLAGMLDSANRDYFFRLWSTASEPPLQPEPPNRRPRWAYATMGPLPEGSMMPASAQV